MKLATPHDNIFKYVFRRRKAAEDFITNYLPAEISKQFDLSTLAIRKDSFIDEKLAEHFSDILYEVGLKDGGTGGIYLLFEHKSFPKRQTVLDLLRYMVKIWVQQTDEKAKGETLILKPIVPILIYHSPKEWGSPSRFVKLFSKELPEELKPFVPDYQLVLCDLTQFSDSEIKGEVLSRIVFLMWKHFYSGQFLKRLPSILALLAELEDKKTGLEYLSVLLRYLSQQKVVQMSTKELKTVVEEALPKGADIMLSLAEQWKQEGIEQGVQKGIEQGVQEGERRTLRQMCLRLLEGRFGAVPVDLVLRTEKLLTEQLRHLFDLAINATSLEEIEKALA